MAVIDAPMNRENLRIPYLMYGRAVSLLIAQCFFFLSVYLYVGADFSLNNDHIVTGFVILWLFSAWNLSLSLSSDGVSLRVIYWFYCSIFLGALPLLQYATRMWSYPIDEDSIVAAMSVIALSHFAYLGGYGLGRSTPQKGLNAFIKNGLRERILSSKLKLAAIAGFLVAFTLVASFGFTPGGSVIRAAFGNTYSPVESVLDFVVRPSIFLLLIYLVIYKQNFPSSFGTNVCLALTILSVALVVGPFAGNRSLIFFLYFALFVTLYRPKPSRAYGYGLVLFMGIFGFYFQNVARNLLLGGEFTPLTTAFLFQGNFDGFENLAHVISYVDQTGVFFGWQLFGSLLFFVPRSLWPDKPTGTGDLLARDYLDSQDGNIAMPLVAEFYVNFDLIGVLVFMYFVAYINAVLDRRFKAVLKLQRFPDSAGDGQQATFASYWVSYCVLLGVYLFILRGDLISGVSFLLGMAVPLYLVARLVLVKKRAVVGRAHPHL